ncbi:aminoacyl-histidine dipeptidase [Clostridium algidicarnis]|uniref:aminoacyl-histidine dipeptidase n=1 Tax=Clostridium algidicarnis TaxID=37659 RepID=UPI001C0C74E4|nr:aminoacyl-histidine dipeptidase [Clostridium algidicarnis]MBU3206810.1 aminoacyl-histidine dipeptidase [Clostridium algidicarnis]
MSFTSNLKPQNVFNFFEELTKIPHCSAEEKQISDYLVNFAKIRGLEVVQDKNLNVIIKKQGTKGYENAPTVIIQGHMDMVCEKSKNSSHDFSKDALELRLDGDHLYATNTTLGGDDGIAVAYGLALLDSDSIAHPPIELLITTEEETGMFGADALDPSSLKGKILLNIDAEEEGIYLVSCAGGVNSTVIFKPTFEETSKETVEIEISGLNGGHSGMEIIKQRANAVKLMGRVLNSLKKELSFNLVSMNGGSKHNAIARECNSIITVNSDEFTKVQDLCKKLEETFKNEFRVEDPNISINVSKSGESKRQMSCEDTEKLITFLMTVPNGVQTVSKDIENLVESSLNIGILETCNDEVKFTISVRSSVKSLKYEISERIESLAKITGGNFTTSNEYPEWQYEEDSKIRELCIETHKKLFNEEPKIDAIHAGLECGLLKEKMQDTDMISFGPNLYDVHTPNEHLSVSSVERVWNFLQELLKNIK